MLKKLPPKGSWEVLMAMKDKLFFDFCEDKFVNSFIAYYYMYGQIGSTDFVFALRLYILKKEETPFKVSCSNFSIGCPWLQEFKFKSA